MTWSHANRTSHPLCWPEGWKRTDRVLRAQSRFGGSYTITMSDAVSGLQLGKPTAMACDKWNRVEDNVRAIAKHIEALRGQERWGVGSIERAFTGYQALPNVGEASGIQWWTTLGVPVNANRDQVRDAYLLLVKKHHPDRNGDPELFRRVQEAWDLFSRVKQEAAAA